MDPVVVGPRRIYQVLGRRQNEEQNMPCRGICYKGTPSSTEDGETKETVKDKRIQKNIETHPLVLQCR